MIELPVLLVVLIILITIFSFLLLVIKYYKKPIEGEALIIASPFSSRVSLSGTFVMPLFEELEKIDLTIKPIQVKSINDSQLLTKDHVNFDIEATFYLKINHTLEDIKIASSAIGSINTFNNEKVKSFFKNRLIESLKVSVNRISFFNNFNPESKDQFKENNNLSR